MKFKPPRRVSELLTFTKLRYGKRMLSTLKKESEINPKEEKDMKTKSRCLSPDLNRGQPDLQSGALPV